MTDHHIYILLVEGDCCSETSNFDDARINRLDRDALNFIEVFWKDDCAVALDEVYEWPESQIAIHDETVLELVFLTILGYNFTLDSINPSVWPGSFILSSLSELDNFARLCVEMVYV